MQKLKLLSFAAVLFSQITLAEPVPELPRSSLLGVAPTETGAGEPVIIDHIIPNSTASALGLRTGDILKTVNGNAISDFSALLDAVRGVSTGQPIVVNIVRDGKRQQLNSIMQPRPYETSEIAEVSYESVVYQDNQLRSIIYKPKKLVEGKRAPAVFYIQGYTCDSIDYGMSPNMTVKQLIEQYVADGFVVYRVEKPGAGESRSIKPCSEINFTEENTAFVEGLRTLKKLPYVNPNNVFIFGHSLGVLHSVVVAKNESVAGIIGYGGVYKLWYEYLLDIYSEQANIHYNVPSLIADGNRRRVKPFLHAWLNTSEGWFELLQKPKIKKALSGGLVPMLGEQVFDRHYTFFRDMNQYDIPAYWEKLDVPVLMIHGSLDIQAIDKQWTIDIVTASQRKQSLAVTLEGAEHSLMRYESKSAYRSAMRSGEFNPAEPGDRFDSRIGAVSIEWMKAVV